MFKRLSGAKWWLLGIITCGIYNLVCWSRMTKNLNKMATSVGQKKIMGFIPQLLLGCITFGIVSLVWMIKFFSLMARLNRTENAGVAPGNGFVMFIMSCIPIYSFFWMANANNKLADAYEVAIVAKAAAAKAAEAAE